MRSTRRAAPTGPSITALADMSTSWQSTAPSPAMYAKLPTSKMYAKLPSPAINAMLQLINSR